MRRFDTLLDATVDLMRRGFRADMSPGTQPPDGFSFHFRRASWLAVVQIQKNGRVAVRVL